MNHSFDVEVAKKVGVYAAIIFNYIGHWYAVNKGNNTNFHSGTWWMRMSVSGFKSTYEYMSPKEIRMAIDKLFNDGLILVTNTNESGYDRTLSYSPSQAGLLALRICPTGQMDLPATANGIAPQGKSKLPTGQINKGEVINKVINKDVLELPQKKEVNYMDRPTPKTDTELSEKIFDFLNAENDISIEARRGVYEQMQKTCKRLKGNGLSQGEALKEVIGWFTMKYFANNKPLNITYSAFIAALKAQIYYYDSQQPDIKPLPQPSPSRPTNENYLDQLENEDRQWNQGRAKL